MRNLLISLKGRLCELADKEQDSYDLSELEYLLKLVDSFLMGKEIMSGDNLTAFIESVINVAIMQVKFDLLDYVKPFSSEMCNFVSE